MSKQSMVDRAIEIIQQMYDGGADGKEKEQWIEELVQFVEDQNRIINKQNESISEAVHELSTLHGLWALDRPIGDPDAFQINTDDVLRKIEKR